MKKARIEMNNEELKQIQADLALTNAAFAKKLEKILRILSMVTFDDWLFDWYDAR